MVTMPPRLPRLPGGASQSASQLRPDAPPTITVEMDLWRGTAAERGYDHNWRVASKRYRQANPLCVCCLANGRTTAAELVDHVLPVATHRQLRMEPSNWQALCQRCHDTVKREMERRFEMRQCRVADLRLDRLIDDAWW